MHPKELLKLAPLLFVISFISYSIIWGEHGWLNYSSLKQTLNNEEKRIDHLLKNIKQLKTSIGHYQEDSFFTEKIARCDLSLGYTNELVYLVPQAIKPLQRKA